MRVLVLTRVYLPGFKAGGPIRSLSNLVDCLGLEMRFLVLTGDRDSLDKTSYPFIPLNRWVRRRKASVFYLSSGPSKLARLFFIFAYCPYDILYLNSLFSPVFTLAPLLLKRIGLRSRTPVVLAPRGELSPGALALKPRKKQLFLKVAKRLGLFRYLIWQATSSCEAHDIKKLMGPDVTIQIAPNVPSPAQALEVTTIKSLPVGVPLRLIFLSRLTPKKNLDFALRVLQGVGAVVDFSIYGPLEDRAYVERCRLLASKLPSHIRVFWKGELRPEDVAETLATHDLFFFPTRSENYGHVIAEALSAGTPVLISDTTPWRDLTAAGVGWDLPLKDISAFTACIDQFAKLTTKDVLAWRQRAHDYALEKLDLPAILDANRKLFINAMPSSTQTET